MRKVTAGIIGLALASGLGVSATPSAFAAAPVAPTHKAVAAAEHPSKTATDELPNAAEDKRRELRQQALTKVISGKATAEQRGASTVVKLGRKPARSNGNGRASGGTVDQYVEVTREKTDKIFVILAEFGDERATDIDAKYGDIDTDPATPGPSTFEGPLNNKVPAPDRAKDNSTVWQPDYNRDHYQHLYFGAGVGVDSVKTYYETQSSGRYSVDGQVSDWVKVRYNEARYGRSDGFPCASNVCSNTWALVRDAANQWVADQSAAGRTAEQIKADLATYDQWDRYDFDGDGNFNEPDGYLDHFQIVHAGGDQADGDPSQGEDAIWSHRWYVNQAGAGTTGPAVNKLGGAPVGDTGLWIGDYTIQPENGGLSVFTHEFGHDLGLPDSYDTSGLGDNNNEHWTLMAQSRLNAAGEALGTRPGDIGQWEKLQLGWLDYETAVAGQRATYNLGPAEFNTTKAQGLVVVLPKRQVTTQLGAPFEGANQWFSGNHDDLDATLTRPVDLIGKTSADLTAKVRYSIELDFDYLYVEASSDGGVTWTKLDGTVNGAPFAKDANNSPALTGSTAGEWVDLSVPMSSLAGQSAQVRFHYVTDGGVSDGGFFADAISVVADGAPVFTDGAEAGDNGWSADGFSVVGASSSALFDNFYIATHRSYVGFDRYLKTGPYNFGFADVLPDFVEHYPYQQGLLVSYWDTSQADNNTNVHPGEGLSMIVDAHPKPMFNLTGLPWRARIQMYDAPFSLTKADSFTLHIRSQPSNVRGQAAQSTFDDTKQYWFPELPNHGVKLPAVGVKLQVTKINGTSLTVKLSPKAP